MPGLAAADHGDQPRWPRARPTASAARGPFNLGLFHTGCGGGPTGAGERTIFSLNTSIQAVGEGNYGRLGAEQQQRYTDANAEPMFGEPATRRHARRAARRAAGDPAVADFDGAGPDDANIDRCWTCRSMFMQAWGHYGTAWPVIHQQLGVRPDLGTRRARGRAAGAATASRRRGPRTSGSATGALDLVRASRDGNRYTTTVDADGARPSSARDRAHAAARREPCGR